jgi:hypothetical protein
MEDQMRTRHQIEHGADGGAVEARRRALAERREPLLVLRPQAMHHEGIRPGDTALRIGRPVDGTLAGLLAKTWRPGQREHVEIELAGRVLAPVLLRQAAHRHPVRRRVGVLSEREGCDEKAENGRGDNRAVQDGSEHGTPLRQNK